MRVVGKKTARLVAGQIVRYITMEGLDRLPPESELLQQYGVSRPSLREALRILEMYGVISLRPGPGGGAVVNPVASYQFATASSLYFHLLGLTMRDLVATRIQLEPLMARIAAERVKSGIPWDAQDPPKTRSPQPTSTNFHFAVAKFAGDPILLLFADALRDISVEISNGEHTPQGVRGDLSITHAEIESAIVSGDPAEAEKLMRAHIEEYLHLLDEHSPYLLNQVIDWG
ncbi:FadR/GntR family transcriptional regulator [Streptomyces viridiviolaceus]|uniref:FadR/GntR family transcriptional regulator n=1 Tax=Streptomyces viridiviolaceus TaxID=68282 RepID=A0ABW2EBN8_9ACTN|nr:FCD domain-containing protein [Streptomyces viridiviolaceus]